MSGNVHQTDEDKLKATVKQKEKDRTITGTATVTPSGDMARKAPWDRNLLRITEHANVIVGTTSWVARWRYTVPTDRIYCNSIFSLIIELPLNDSSKKVVCAIDMNVGAERLAVIQQRSATEYIAQLNLTPVFYLLEDDYLEGKTINTDDVSHTCKLTLMGLEFDI